MAKRAREQALKERRERKRAKKADAAAKRAAAKDAPAGEINGDGASPAPESPEQNSSA
jgi:hypothetical protein